MNAPVIRLNLLPGSRPPMWLVQKDCAPVAGTDRGAIEAGTSVAKGSGKSKRDNPQLPPTAKATHGVWSDPELKKRLNDPGEANAPWRRLRDLEFELCNRAAASPTKQNVEVADLVRTARVAEELNQGLPGFSQVTIAQLPRRAGPERTKAIGELIRFCEFNGEAYCDMLLKSIARPRQWPESAFSDYPREFLNKALVLGLVSKGSVPLSKWLVDRAVSLGEKLRAKLLVDQPNGREIAMLVLEAAGVSPADARDWTRGNRPRSRK